MIVSAASRYQVPRTHAPAEASPADVRSATETPTQLLETVQRLYLELRTAPTVEQPFLITAIRAARDRYVALVAED